MTIATDRRKPAAAPSRFDDIQLDLATLAFRDALPMVSLGSTCIAAVTLVGASDTRDPALWRLAALLALFGAVRIAICLLFKASDPAALTAHSARIWTNRFALATLVYTLCFTLVTFHNFSRHDPVGECLCTLGTFALEASFTSRVGLPPWFSHTATTLLLGGLGISATNLTMDRLPLAFALLGVLAYVQWVSAESRFHIVVEQLRAEHKLRHLAARDPLTGLVNRRSFNERVETACAQASSFAVLYLDLDRFKQVNDTHGHAVGDELLRAVAARLGDAVRSTDLVARFGGDEFAVLLMPLAHDLDAKHCAARIVDELSHPFELCGKTVHIGASVGVRVADGPLKDPSTLLQAADRALYRVKRSGGGDFSFAPQHP
jgi:diguanylate cyclase (GGDEF)-like protein